jgi:hypothetical protein
MNIYGTSTVSINHADKIWILPTMDLSDFRALPTYCCNIIVSPVRASVEFVHITNSRWRQSAWSRSLVAAALPQSH